MDVRLGPCWVSAPGACPISSNKSMIGAHAVGPPAPVEAVITLMTLEHQRIPPTINYLVPDPTIPLDVVPNVARDASIRNAISNSFGFGGQNVSLVMARSRPDGASAGVRRVLVTGGGRGSAPPSSRRWRPPGMM